MRFDDALSMAARRMRLGHAVRIAGTAAIAGASIYAIIVLWRRGVDPAGVSYVWAFTPFAVAAIAMAVAYGMRRPRRFDVAAHVDRRLELREAISSAVSAQAGTTTVADAAWTDALAAQADRRAGAITPEAVRAAFALPRPKMLFAALAIIALAHLLPPRFGFPGTSAGAADDRAADEKKKAAETRSAREAARRLEARAKDLARAAEIQKLEAARIAAMKIAEAAKKLSENVASKKDAFSELSRMSKEIDQAKASALGADGKTDAFKNTLDEDPLSELAKQLDSASADDLDGDLSKFAQEMREEAKNSTAEKRTPRVDRRTLEDLMHRLQMAKDALRRAQEAAKADPSLGENFAKLSNEQQELLDRIYKKLERFQSKCNGSGQSGEFPLTPEELKEIAEFLESLSTEKLQGLMNSIREGAAMEDLEELVEGARKESNEGSQKMSSARMAELLDRLAKQCSGTGPKKDGDKPGGESPGQKPGAEGHAQTDGLGGHPGDPDAALREHVPGKIDPRGNQGQKVPFQGIPKAKDAKSAFDATVERAAAAAEEGVAKDRVPPALRPYVRRYFDALKKTDAEKK